MNSFRYALRPGCAAAAGPVPGAAAALLVSRCQQPVARARQLQPTVCASSPQADQQLDDVVAEAAARAGWDPHGLLPVVQGQVDHFSRRARQKQQQQQQQGQHGEDQQVAPESTEQVHSSSTVDGQGHAGAGVQQTSAYTTVTQQQQQQHAQQVHEAHSQQKDAQAAAEVAAQQQKQGTSNAVDAGAVRASAATAAFAPADPVQYIPPIWLKQGGIPANDPAAYDRQAFLEKMATKFIPIDPDFPGLRIVNFDPAILTIEGFMTPEECEQWQQAASDSGCLQQSKIGAGNAAAAAGGSSANVYGVRRTSSSLLLDAQTQLKSPRLVQLMSSMQARALKLLAHLDAGRSWGPAGRLPAGGQYCFEHPQVARYITGQHFLAHEDAFPPLLATSNGFQRHATLLLYLNDVQQGGATHFDHLGFSIQPRQGMALLFFPAYASGAPDARTLHTAQDAADTKWVMQQWVARGYPTPKAVLKAVKVAALAGPEADIKAAAAADQQVVREVFRVAASSSTDGYGAHTGPSQVKRSSKKGSSKKKNSGSKKGFSSR